MASPSYNVNRFYAFVLSVEYFINLNFFYPLCINISHSVSFFCYDAFLQSNIICFLTDHKNKLNMISITTYQCFGYFFSMLFHLQLVKKAIFLCFLLLSYCLFHFFFDNSISDKNPRLILKLGIPTYVPMTSFNEKTETSLSASDKASKVLSGNLSIVIQLLGVWRNSLCH